MVSPTSTMTRVVENIFLFQSVLQINLLNILNVFFFPHPFTQENSKNNLQGSCKSKSPVVYNVAASCFVVFVFLRKLKCFSANFLCPHGQIMKLNFDIHNEIG